MIDDDLLDNAEATDVFGSQDEENGALKVVAEPKVVERPMLKKVIQGALLAAGQPLSLDKLKSLFDPAVDVEPERSDIVAVLEEIVADCADAGFELVEVGSGWRYQVRAETAPWVNRLWEEKPQKYSRALLETLSLIAYRQPITRGDIEEIRGVAVSSHIIKTLTERDWVKVVGHRDVPGRPSLYATTRQFLDYFNLKSLEELPSLGEIADFDKLGPELDLPLEPDNDQVEDAAPEEVSESGEIDDEAAEAFLSAVADQADDTADTEVRTAAYITEPELAVDGEDESDTDSDDTELADSESLVSDDGVDAMDESESQEAESESSGDDAKPLPSLFND